MFLFQKGQTIANRYTVVFPHKEGSYAETYRVKDTSGKLRFLKLIYYSRLGSKNPHTYDTKNNEVFFVCYVPAVWFFVCYVPAVCNRLHNAC